MIPATVVAHAERGANDFSIVKSTLQSELTSLGVTELTLSMKSSDVGADGNAMALVANGLLCDLDAAPAEEQQRRVKYTARAALDRSGVNPRTVDARVGWQYLRSTALLPDDLLQFLDTSVEATIPTSGASSDQAAVIYYEDAPIIEKYGLTDDGVRQLALRRKQDQRASVKS